MEDYVVVYVTAPNVMTARYIGRMLVEERLVACANILPGVQSLYWWNGVVEEAEEAVLIVKTRCMLVEALTARVQLLHPYECPCIVALPIVGGARPFLEWLGTETQTAA